MKQVSTKVIGLAAGTLFFAHALIPNSNAGPLIWPALAGAFAVYRAGASSNFLHGLGAAARAGAIAGLLFVAATAAALALLGMPGSASVAAWLGASGPVVLDGAVLSSLAFAALIGVAMAVVAGAVTYPVARRQA